MHMRFSTTFCFIFRPPNGETRAAQQQGDVSAVQEALAEVHSGTNENTMSDLTNPRVWYQHADSVRKIMHKSSNFSEPSEKHDEEQDAIFINGRKQLLAQKLHSKPRKLLASKNIKKISSELW